MLQIKEGVIIHSKYFPVLKGVSPFRSLFFCSPKTTQYRPKFFSVNGSIICSGLHFWRHWFNMAKILSKFGEQQLVTVNHACGFNQSETGKYFEWLINTPYSMVKTYNTCGYNPLQFLIKTNSCINYMCLPSFSKSSQQGYASLKIHSLKTWSRGLIVTKKLLHIYVPNMNILFNGQLYSNLPETTKYS